jgi:hypothetical protein
MNLSNAKRMIFCCILFGCFLALSGCDGDSASDYKQFFHDPSAEPVKAVIRTTVPLAYAASVAMATACTTGSAYPCNATVTITDDDSALPLRFANFGTIIVYGYWSTADDALLTVLFVNTYAGSSLFRVNHVSAFPVKRTVSGILRIVYASVDIDIVTGPVGPNDLSGTQPNVNLGLISSTTSSTDPSSNMDMEAWIVDVDAAGTTYTISGGGQYIETSSGAVSILQLGMANVVMGPGCEISPSSGLAAMQEVDSSDSQLVVAAAALSFGTNETNFCDGRAKVVVGTGNYLLATGTYIPLNLSVP